MWWVRACVCVVEVHKDLISELLQYQGEKDHHVQQRSTPISHTMACNAISSIIGAFITYSFTIIGRACRPFTSVYT